MCHNDTAIMVLPFKCPPLKRILQIAFKQIIDIRFQVLSTLVVLTVSVTKSIVSGKKR